MFHEGGGVVCGGRAAEGVLVDDGNATSMLVGLVSVRYLVSVGVAVAMSGADAGFSQVSVMNTASGLWFVMVSQISVACLSSEQALIRMQWSSLESLVFVFLGGVWTVGSVEILESLVALVFQVKRQLQKEKGFLVFWGEVWTQLLLSLRPGSQARSSSEGSQARSSSEVYQ